MNNIINVGVIGCENSEEILLNSGAKNEDKVRLKILALDDATAGFAKTTYPKAEIVNNVKAIVDDKAIELVYVSSNRNNLPLVKEALQDGKQVRIL